MDNGGGGGGGIDGGPNLAHKLASLSLVTNNTIEYPNSNPTTITTDNKDGLFQVFKAVEAAEVTIKQQAEENTRLRAELQKKYDELEKYRSDNSTAQRPKLFDQWDDHAQGPHRAHQLDSAVNQGYGARGTDRSSLNDPSGIVSQEDKMRNNKDPAIQTRAESHSESSKISGNLKVLLGGQTPVDNAGLLQFSSPSTTSFSPGRHQMEGESSSGHGLMPVSEVNNSSLWKQDLFVKIREHEEEILELRKHLADYSIKEAQARNEKYVLEKRIAYMRMAFDQQQQDLVDAASKALSYRQDIIEENIRLTYALQAAQQERTTFVSTLLPLLAEYSLRPPVPDAQSIVSNLKVLFKHLQEKLIITEAKLKESQYQLAPWRSDVNSSNFPPQSPSHSIGVALTSNKNGLELVRQPAYSRGNVSTTSDPQTTGDWDILGQHRSGLSDGVVHNPESDDLVRYSPLASSNAASQDIPTQLSVSWGDLHPMRYNAEQATSKQVTFSDPVSSTEMDDLDMEGQQNDRDPSVNWVSKNSSYPTTPDDPTVYSSNLAPVLEEPSSSYSEAGDDDPLPAIEGLQISGDAFPGQQLQACGYSINGTTSCNFEWIRHLEDGSVNYIEGAKQPTYLVTADDVDTYLAIEVQPLDNRKRKGELVKVFANEHRKITCDPEMQNCIEKTLHNGQVAYGVSFSTGYLDIWERATLMIKRDGYSIKGGGPTGVLVTEKFSSTISVTVPVGDPAEFSIISSSGDERILRANSPTDISCSRDTIVLTLRLFMIRAGEKRKGKKKGFFFKS